MFEFYHQNSEILLSLVLATILFVSCRELSEHAKEHGFNGWGAWWTPNQSHWNKHQWDDLVLVYLQSLFPNLFSRLWITKFVGRILSAAFKTALVWITDAEHFFQFVSFIAVLVMVQTLGSWEWVLLVYGVNVMVGFLKQFTKIK